MKYVLWLLVLCSCTPNSSKDFNNIDILAQTIKFENLGEFYQLDQADEILTGIKNGYIKYVLLKFSSLENYSHHSRINDLKDKLSKQISNLWSSDLGQFSAGSTQSSYLALPFTSISFAGDYTFLIRVDEKFDPQLYKDLDQIGLVNPQLKYTQNVEYIISKIEKGDADIYGDMLLFSGSTSLETKKILSASGIANIDILDVKNNRAIIKIRARKEIDKLLNHNSVHKILATKAEFGLGTYCIVPDPSPLGRRLSF